MVHWLGLDTRTFKFPIIENTNQEIEFQLFVETYQLVEPFIIEKDATYELLTYSTDTWILKQWYNSKQLELYMFGWVGERTELI